MKFWDAKPTLHGPMILVACAILIGGIFGLWTRYNQQSHAEPVDTARVAENMHVLQKCRDQNLCVGGFVRFGTGKISRIDYCANNCQHYEIGISRLRDGADLYGGQFLTQFEIVSPDDRPKWDAVAVQYAQQFVVRQ